MTNSNNVKTQKDAYYWCHNSEDDIYELHYVDSYDGDYVVADLFGDVENYWECSLKERITESDEVKECFWEDSLEKAKSEVYQLVQDQINTQLYNYFSGIKHFEKMLDGIVRFDESEEGGEKNE